MANDHALHTTAQTSRQEYLSKGCIPKELWTEIDAWLSETGLNEVYLDPEEAIGAWWGNCEARKMGFTINYATCGVMPSEWCPRGDDWEMAQAEAKFRFVASYQQLLDNGALIKIEE